MKQSEINEWNKLLDIFMESKGEYISHKDSWGGEVWGSYKPNSYHSNWNLLMPVVEKIESLESDSSVTISKTRTKLEFRFDKNKSQLALDQFVLRSDNTKLINTYKVVIIFIKWFNKNK